MTSLVAIISWGILFLALGVQAGCGGVQGPLASPLPPQDQEAESPQQVIWNFYPRGLTLNLNTDPKLNQYGAQANAVMLCVYQLSSSASFQALSQVQGGWETLLSCAKFDATVVSYRRIFLQPGVKTLDISDRLEGARAVGLVAGYMAPSSPKATICHADFPLRKTMVGVPLFRSPEYTPDPLTLDLKLGPDFVTCYPRDPEDDDPYSASTSPPPASDTGPTDGNKPETQGDDSEQQTGINPILVIPNPLVNVGKKIILQKKPW